MGACPLTACWDTTVLHTHCICCFVLRMSSQSPHLNVLSTIRIRNNGTLKRQTCASLHCAVAHPRVRLLRLLRPAIRPCGCRVPWPQHSCCNTATNCPTAGTHHQAAPRSSMLNATSCCKQHKSSSERLWRQPCASGSWTAQCMAPSASPAASAATRRWPTACGAPVVKLSIPFLRCWSLPHPEKATVWDWCRMPGQSARTRQPTSSGSGGGWQPCSAHSMKIATTAT